MHTEVVVVGGGLAGLVAARLLHEAGVDFQLFEARDRFGGRILSVDARGYPSADGFDLGPSWFWPDMQPEMEKLVHSLGLAVFPQHEEGDVIVDRYALEDPRRFRAMRQESSSMRLAGGMGTLVTALAAGLPIDRLSLATNVTHMSIAGKRVVMIAAGQDCAVQTVEAAQLILAVPLRLSADTISFEPLLDPKILSKWRDTATWMAPHAKFFALYERPFWRDEGLSGDAQSFVGPLVEIHDATTASGRAALFGFVGPDAARREAMGEKVLIASALTQLVRLFGPRAAHPTATLFKDWSADALTATAADRVSSGHLAPSRDPWLRAPWADLLTVASSETSLAAPGYLAGAVEAGSRAAREVIQRLQATSAETIAC
ncbi:FAD-dependent oxidoreductase [Hyphomicrobiales bacterium BP6-180914]|uniref:FAD-dependent oxidoreductase n=2 Tax=Lichenifustis flavocetrariae TaxID=2949735 RepID=A0AA41Z0J7_9HYPH|nr:FAD-dependent oxidoreductase [Lichenifustis flavocetrariae]MCW6511984.1 FAD-dependent oxidoreductase [Lichenifustis flavocetrariae]